MLGAAPVVGVEKKPLPMQEDVGDARSIPGLGRSQGGGHGNPL